MTSFLFDDITKALNTLPRSSRYDVRSRDYSQYPTESGYTVEVPVVGAKREDVSVSVENNVLAVTVKPSVESRYSKEFSCSWHLPEGVDQESVGAKLEHGLLTLTVSKVKTTPKKVTVAVA